MRNSGGSWGGGGACFAGLISLCLEGVLPVFIKCSFKARHVNYPLFISHDS
jgi:hypothetical protein